nr:hypothetical protein [Zea mays]
MLVLTNSVCPHDFTLANDTTTTIYYILYTIYYILYTIYYTRFLRSNMRLDFPIVWLLYYTIEPWAMFPERDCLLSGQQSYTYSRLLYDDLTSFLGSARSSTLRPIQSKSKKRCFV